MMLAKILADMYVEPELLAELDEEQKQILFCKMREEQLRKFKEYDEEQNGIIQERKEGARRIQWRIGVDGEPWVWVMGEHSTDRSIDEIMEQETHNTAETLAQQEAARNLEEEERVLKEKLRQEQLDDENERVNNNMLNGNASTSSNNQASVRNGFNNTPLPNRPPIALKPTHLSPPKQTISTNTPTINNTIENNDELNALMDTLRRARVEINHENDSHVDKEAEEREFKREREVLTMKLRKEAERRIEEEKQKRTNEIYESLKEAREKNNREADKEAEEERRYWDIIEKKAREQEEQIRLIARKARELHRRESGESQNNLPEPIKPPRTKKTPPNSPEKDEKRMSTDSNTQLKLSRPPKPKNREAIVQWFVREEQRKGTGLDPKTSLVAPWFHGIISREDAENLLLGLQVGSYLVRVSERIWGYVLSFQTGSKVKHFLIECLSNGYQFMGSDQVFHKSLWDLVSYHQTVPVTILGKEVLIHSVGQSSRPPDFEELFTSQESSYC